MYFVCDLEHNKDQILLLLWSAVGDVTLQRHSCEQTNLISKLSKWVYFWAQTASYVVLNIVNNVIQDKQEQLVAMASLSINYFIW